MSKLSDEDGGVLQIGPAIDPHAIRHLILPPPPPGAWERAVERVIEAAYALTHAADRFWPEQPQHVAPKLDALHAAVVNYWRAMGGDEETVPDV